jgi:thiol-disulfide isomerase/thioredoxin
MITRIVAAALFLTASAASFALDIKPYSAQALSAEQQAGKPVTLHFHANWCPTCRAQEKVFQQFKGDASVPGTLLVVDYDKEKELKKQLGVNAQSTLIAYHGGVEKTRLGGETDADKLRAALLSVN